MTDELAHVTGGVDTHGRTHHAAVVDQLGRELADASFPATAAGLVTLTGWLRSWGHLDRVGVEGTGSYGATLARHLHAEGITVVEVDRPDRRARRAKGKSDPLDAIAAARAVQAGVATGTPKTHTGPVEAIRALKVARSGAMKARTAAWNQFKALITTAPIELREALRGPSDTELLDRCIRLRPDTAELADPTQATKFALRAVARRISELTDEIRTLDRVLTPVVTAAAPATTALFGAGPDTGADLLLAAGDNPGRLRHDGAFARLCGSAPIPVSSGRTDRHRLHRGGNRQANKALYTIALVRMRHDPRTRAYVARRTAEGRTKREIIRCLKRYIAREVFTAVTKDLTALDAL